MTLSEFSQAVAHAAEQHPEAEVLITTIDAEYNVHSVEFQNLHGSVIFSIQSDEE